MLPPELTEFLLRVCGDFRFKFIILAVFIAIIFLLLMCSCHDRKFHFLSEEDGFIEESLEDIIEEGTGINVDLTPGSRE